MKIPEMKTRACRAIAEYNEEERQKYYALLPRFPAEAFRTCNPDAEDNVRGISVHTTGAAYSYSCWARRVLGRLDPEVERADKKQFIARLKGLDSAAGFAEAAEWAAKHYYETMAEMTSEELDREFTSNWGATVAVELMFEHALVHLMRHRRQLEVLLGLKS